METFTKNENPKTLTVAVLLIVMKSMEKIYIFNH